MVMVENINFLGRCLRLTVNTWLWISQDRLMGQVAQIVFATYICDNSLEE